MSPRCTWNLGFRVTFMGLLDTTPAEDPPPLDPAFKEMKLPPGLHADEAAVALAATDLELDNDLDLVVLSDATVGSAIVNDRLLRFRRTGLPKALEPVASVPMKFPWTKVPDVAPCVSMPFPRFPEITLPSPVVVPPIRLSIALLMKTPFCCLLPVGMLVPAASGPIWPT